MRYEFYIKDNIDTLQEQYYLVLDKEGLDALVDAFDVAIANMNLLADNPLSGRLVKADLFKRCKSLESINTNIKTTLNHLSDKVKR
jgi:hypothetical protein